MRKSYLIFILCLLINLLLAIFIQNNLSPIHYNQQNFLFSELINFKILFPVQLIFLFNTGNLVLFWLISKKIFHNSYSLIPPMIYAFSPWGIYLTIAESFYIFLLFLVLLIIYGLFLIKSNSLGSILVVLGNIILIYSSPIFLLLSPLILFLLPFFKILEFKKIKLLYLCLAILVIPLLSIIYKNQTGFKNILSNEIRIFSDPGLLNNVNSFQGEAQKANLGKLSRISENKYIFFSEYFVLKFTKQLTPSTYFTSQEKLLNFSFSPPILIGFFIPFAYGLFKLLQLPFFRKLLFLSFLLVIPSVLTKQMVDLNHLIIFSPVIIFVVTYGLVEMIKKRKDKMFSFFLLISLLLLIFQTMVIISDIPNKEKNRFIKYYGENYEINR